MTDPYPIQFLASRVEVEPTPDGCLVDLEVDRDEARAFLLLEAPVEDYGIGPDGSEIAWHRIVASNLRALRIKEKKTLEEVATATNISFTYLSNLENGRGNPTLKVLLNLALLYDINPKRLFWYDPT